jgi:hypothetical protein
MSEDSFLTRWSRRKAAAKAEPAVEPAREEEGPAEAQPQPAPEQPAEEVDLSFLPPLEEITAATDITGFFKAGVPEALRTAALRKVWTSDPAIRDFVGLSENAWDFNDPTAIPGFGPMDMPAEQVRRMAAELVGEVRKAAETIEGALEQGPAEPEPTLQQTSAENPNPKTDIAMQEDAAATQQNESPPAESQPRPRPHGSALPR